MNRSHQRHRSQKDFERYEFIVIAIVLPIILTVADIILLLFVYMAKHTPFAEVFHEFFQGFILILMVSLTAASLVRWFRHRQELFEAFKRFEELSNYPDLDRVLNEIAFNSLAIRQKQWPRHATEQLMQKLEELQSFVKTLNSGILIPVPSEIATNEELNLFLESTGTVFVTDYGDIARYWNDQPGKHMLAVNDLAIKNGCTIVRIFIVPPYKGPLGKISIPANFAEIIQAQLDLHIDVRVIRAEAVLPQYCKDVGLFYADKAFKHLTFASVWRRNLDEGVDETGQWYAEWYFNHGELNAYDLMRRRLAHQATPITSKAELEQFINQRPNISEEPPLIAPHH